MALMRLTDMLRNRLADQFTAHIDAGGGVGTIKIYDGVMPADANAPTTAFQKLLATLTFSKPSAMVARNGALTFNTITEESEAPASGVATWARLQDSNGNNVIDVDVTAVGGGGTIEMNTTKITAGGPVRITNFVIAIPTG